MRTSVFDGKTAVEHADAAAAAIRAINHLTLDPDALHYPSDAYRVVGALLSMTERLPQAFNQLAQRLQRWQAARHIGIDAGTEFADDPGAAVHAAKSYLADDAARAALNLRDALECAQAALAHAHYRRPLDDEAEAAR